MGIRLPSLTTAALLAAVGAATPAFGQAEPTAYEQLNLFGDAYDRVRRAYVEEVADDVVIRAAINGLLAALDPNSMFLSAAQYDAMMAPDHDFDGLGIEITMSQGVAQVIAPIDDSPAAAAGLRPGDLIADINRTPIYGMTLPEAVAALRGDPGTILDLLIVREGEDAFITTAELAAVAAPTVRSRLRGSEGYVRIPYFDAGTAAAVTAAVEALVAEAGGELGGLVIDIRNSPGGSIDAGVAVADLFLQDGEIASVRGRNDQITEVFTAGAGELLAGKPIVLLADRGTAGAAEILTGALKDHARAIVVGTPTFGMGSRQTIVPMGAAGFVQLTTGHFYTPSGFSIHGAGIAPEVEVVPSRVIVQESRFPRRTEATLRGALD
ncbi:MAG: S41 family peptidase, partial [Proteobacteria bacterium]|nr:S41 family peptidase [Pseudomonadota bacterium]